MKKQDIVRWRMVLGKEAEEELQNTSQKTGAGGLSLSADEAAMDKALAAIYDKSNNSLSRGKGGKASASGAGAGGAGSGDSSPTVASWLSDIRKYFDKDVVSVIQNDAMERKGLKQLLLEPEVLKSVQPDVSMVSTLMALKHMIPEKTKEIARELVRAVVEDINRRLREGLRRAVNGVLNKRAHSPLPRIDAIDWKRTIARNLKNYSPEHKSLVPERFAFFDRSAKTNPWTVILDMDQSGSMANSVVYGTITGCILAGMASLRTHLVAFDTEVVDLSDMYGSDPVDMLFGIQLGGGTDIDKSVAYCQRFVSEPSRTIFILLSDLIEGGDQSSLVRRLQFMKDSGVKVICLLAMSDEGRPSYDENLAKRLSGLGIPSFACTPNRLPDLLEGALKGFDLFEVAKRVQEK